MCIFETVATESDIICPFLWQLKRNRLQAHSSSLFHLTEVSDLKTLLYSAARLHYKNGISALLNLANWMISLRVDYEQIMPLQKEGLTRNSQQRVCVYIRVCLFRVMVWGSELLQTSQQGHACCTQGNSLCKVRVYHFPCSPVLIMLCSVVAMGIGVNG